MVTTPRKRLILHWTAPRNLFAILLFIVLTIIIQYLIVTFTLSSITQDPTAIALPFPITISVLYHLLPLAVITTLTVSFTHLAAQIALIPRSRQTPKKTKPPKPHRAARLKYLRQIYRNLQRTTQKIKQKILRARTIAAIQRRVSLAQAVIKSATAITLPFIILTILITITAYPTLIPTLTANFYNVNTTFLNFVSSTLNTSKTWASTIPPIGNLAAAIHNGLIAAAPAFRNALKGVGGTLTSGLVSLDAVTKYILIQNTAAWTVAIVTLLYCQYIKSRRYRR